MIILEIVRVVAIAGSGVFAGILFGDRMGATFARPVLDASSFLRFQRNQHVHFARFMPPLTLASVVGGLAWLIMVRAQWDTPQFWLLALATSAMTVGAVLTLSVNIPINNQLMTWNVDAPPENMREIWSRWEKIHTIRTVLWLGAFALEVVALAVFGSPAPN